MRRGETEHGADFRRIHRFFFQQGICQLVEFIAVVGQNLRRGILGVHDKTFDFQINLARRLFAEGFAAGNVASKINVIGSFAVLNRAEFVAHAERADHGARNFGRVFDVRCGSAGDVSDHELFGNASAHGKRHGVEHFQTTLRVTVLVRHHHGDAERGTARDDGNLVQSHCMFTVKVDNCMTGFMPRSKLALAVGDFAAAAFSSPADLVAGLFEIRLGRSLAVVAGGEKRSFVDEVRQIGSDDYRIWNE